MPEKPEGRYEDSYQKNERLKNELRAAIDDAGNFFNVYIKDAGKITDSYEKVRAIFGRVDELKKRKDALSEDLEKMQAEVSGIPMDDDSGKDLEKMINVQSRKAELEGMIDDQQGKIMEVSDKISSLREELADMLVAEPGQMGDFVGTEAIIEMKMQKIEELKRQLDELE